MGGNKLTELDDPVADDDAANKGFVTAAVDAAEAAAIAASGDVFGPASSTENCIMRGDGTDGKHLQASGVTISDADKLVLKASYCPVTSGSLASSTVTFDLNASNYHTHSQTGNHTGATSNASTGQAFQVDLIQDATGGRAWTWWSGITWIGDTPTVNTTASKRHCFGFRCTGSGTYLGFDLGHN